MGEENRLGLSQDAAIVLALAETTMAFAVSPEDEAERWVRVLRLHGWVGAALASLGIGEAPIQTPVQPPEVRRTRLPNRNGAVRLVTRRAHWFAGARDAGAVCTVDVLFALLDVYGKTLDRALYRFGVTRDDLLDRLPADAESGIASG